ncbi:MAG: hypothetical protein Q7R54_02310 [bacterium]|nr:hypothetical protein [bacterium]
MFVVHREPHNPILSPRREHPWEALGAYNPAAIKMADGVRMYYRALANPAALVSPYAGQSTIGMAYSEDGIHFHSRRQVLMPKESWEAFGCEDPRATTLEGKTYLSYTALGGYPYNADNIRVGIAISKEGEHFDERHLVTPFNAKAFALFPDKVDGKYAAFLSVHTDRPPGEVCLALADKIEDFWSADFWTTWYADWGSHALKLRRSEHDHIETGAPPIKTDQGWLFFYSYIVNYFGGGPRVFGVEAALLDLKNPLNVIGRTYPFLVPQEIYEQYGLVPDIVFPTSAIVNNNDTIDLYYGAADTTCAKATLKMRDLLATLDAKGPVRPLMRAKENPILEPRDGFEKVAAFNAAAVELEGKVHLLYRAMGDDHTSTIGLAISKDGIHIDERLDKPCYVPRADFELKHSSGNSGCEDPRAIVIDDMLYMTYTAYDGNKAPRGAITSISVKDFLARRFDKWALPIHVTPDQVDDKDVGLLPEAVKGQYLLYHRVSGRVCADLLPDLTFKKPVSRCIEIMGPREGMWDALKVGIAGPPIKVENGWLLIYHGVSRRSRYRLGAALLDPYGTIVLARTADPIFEPVEEYEKNGEVGQVVFSCGQIVRGDTLYLYYGGGDRVLGVATGSVSHILSTLS